VTVSGAGVLAGLGSGAPVTEESFADATRRTFDGRVVAVVRPTEVGTITVRAESDGCDPVSATIRSTPHPGER
jgi:hypothetical protein